MAIRTLLGFIRNIFRHPIGRRQILPTLIRIIRWQFGSRILGAPVAMPFIGGTQLLVSTGMHGATMNLYVGLQEFEDMAFVLHLLRRGDTCVDIGSNVGVYTVLAAGVRQANVISIEPVPSTFEQLINNVNLNRIGEKVSALNIGIAAERGELRFSESFGPTNHVIRKNDRESGVSVPVATLDSVVPGSMPVLIKIDVEGYEQEVLNGGRQLLSNPSLLAVIIELNGLGSRYGFQDYTIDQILRELGFVSARYDPFERELTETTVHNTTGNTLYIRFTPELTDRLKCSDPIDVYGIPI